MAAMGITLLIALNSSAFAIDNLPTGHLANEKRKLVKVTGSTGGRRSNDLTVALATV